MVSDLSEYHGLSLVDVLAGHTHSPRTLLALLMWLPDDSATAASMRGEVRGWGADRHLVASLFDAIQVNTWVTSASGAKRKPKRPTPFPRPTGRQQQKPPRVVRVADIAKGR